MAFLASEALRAKHYYVQKKQSLNTKYFTTQLLLSMIMLALLQSWSLQAQHFKVSWYNAESGMSTEVVKSIIQDSTGFIWIGSDEGITRFDGNEFLSFRDELSNNFVKSFQMRKNGQLLAITDLGIDEVTSFPDTVSIRQVVEGSSQPSLTTITYPKTSFEDSRAHLWIGENAGISVYRNGKLRKYAFPSSEASTSFTYAFTFAENDQQELWSASYNGTLYQFDAINDLFIPYKLSQKIPNITGMLFEGDQLLISGYSGLFSLSLDQTHKIATVKRLTSLRWITCMFKSNDGTIYLGTRNDGLYKLHKQGETIETQSIQALNKGRVSSITDDRFGGLWIGTHKGIAHFHQSFFQSLSLDGKKSYVQDIVESPTGQIFIAVGRQVFQLTAQGERWQTEEIWSYLDSYAMRLAIQDSLLVIGLSSGNLQTLNLHNGELHTISITDRNPQYNTFINALHIGKDGQVWVSKNGLLGIYKLSINNRKRPTIQHFSSKHGLKDNIILMKENANGELFLLANSSLRPLYKYNPKQAQFEVIPIRIPPCNKELELEDFDFIQPDQLAIASSCGLWKVDVTKESIEQVNSESIDGFSLANPAYNAVIALPNQQYILGSKIGLILNTQQQGLHYDEASGLPTKSISANNILLDRKKQLWVGTVEGTAMAAYQRINSQNTPPPLITSIKRNGVQENIQGFTANANLAFNSYLELSFSALIFPSNTIRYQYRIVGRDSTWQSAHKKSSVFIPQLPAGDYTFQVRAYHPNGYNWSKPTELNFSIQKAWYLKWWMFSIYFLLLVAFIYVIVRFNTWRLVRTKNKLEEIVQERMAESLMQHQLLNQQKEEIERQRDDIQNKNKWLEEAHHTIEQKNEELLLVNQQLEAKVKRRTSELDAALVELQKYNAELDYFIYRAAHDLRGPIARIMGLANLIRMQNSDEEIALFVDRMDFTLAEMGAMLTRLMETLELKSSRLVLQPVQLNVFFEQLTGLFTAAPVHIAIHAPEGLVVYVDVDLLERMFENLLQNAIHFKQGYQKAIVSIHAVYNAENQTIDIQLIDCGEGIVEHAQEHIFDMFYVGTEASKGAGLGLYEVNVIIERLKGKIQLVSSKRGETIFKIILPAYQ